MMLEDLKRELQQTDNYIEKYLPMKMLNYIHDSMMYVLDRKELIKLFEYLSPSYQYLEECINNDDGISHLQKKDFHVPNLYMNNISLTRKQRELTLRNQLNQSLNSSSHVEAKDEHSTGRNGSAY